MKTRKPLPRFTTQLLKWYRARERYMPWRGETDPYRIWLSEVMLQQTQVETVIPYYQRWLKKYPTLQHVAQASEDEVLKTWEGLGYYARVRNFRYACQQVVERYNGQIPSDPEMFSLLKGVGPYIQAAVLSIAFRTPIAAVDGNVKRGVARLLKLSTPPSQSLSKIELFLKQMISKENPGDFNQAMMDLGATLCTRSRPKCEQCPVSSECGAYQSGMTHLFPKLEKRLIRPHYSIAVGVIWKGDKILVSKRKSNGLLGGLWEFPGGKVEVGETSSQCVVREVKEELDVRVKVGRSLGKIQHAYTHFSIDMEVFMCQYVSGQPKAIECADFRWITWDELKNLAFPKSNHKVFPLIRGAREARL